MSTVRTLVSMTVNGGWQQHQLDVKNTFLHGDLLEEVYMEIPPGFDTNQTVGKVCMLKKSLYGLQQSSRTWFDRFRKAMIGMTTSKLMQITQYFLDNMAVTSLCWLCMSMI
jgi:Reverse transcriptase (RNA-dependent DNA polymerase)